MSQHIKIVFYLALIAGVTVFGLGFRASLHRSLDAAPGDPSTNAPTTAEAATSPADPKGMGRMMTFAALGLASLVGLGMLVARDISHIIAHRVHTFIFDEDLQGERDPEYEEAEKVWANGNFLEAIQLMRDYLKERPLEQYVALRIAEIYEKDLGNYVAASLEYEEILRKNLPPERWGWAAIHLANLYSGRLNKSEQATALLRRIVNEYPLTAAAKKARERLGEPEAAPDAESPPEGSAEGSKPSSLNLPPGFRPK
jgi:tetratricopeptide (TPR) repeat protein